MALNSIRSELSNPCLGRRKRTKQFKLAQFFLPPENDHLLTVTYVEVLAERFGIWERILKYRYTKKFQLLQIQFIKLSKTVILVLPKGNHDQKLSSLSYYPLFSFEKRSNSLFLKFHMQHNRLPKLS